MEALKKTALHGFHISQKAKTVDFAGFHMPMAYAKLGTIKEHHYSRKVVSMMDVSHVGQFEIRGADRERFMEHITPVDFQKARHGQASLSMMMNERAGIKDDCMLTKMDDHLVMVLNGGCKDKDVAHIEDVLQNSPQTRGADVQFIPLERSLIAVQGPKAATILSEFVDGIPDMDFMSCRQKVNVKGMEVQLSRCGYTGEDGFEIAVSNEDVVPLVELLQSRHVELIGLGARDTLRMETGLNLYGNELSEETNPVALRLMWWISKRRMEEGGFIGHAALKHLRANATKGAVPQLRVGLVSTGPVPRRDTVIEVDGKEVGYVTSGVPSPTLKKNVALGFIDRAFADVGTKVDFVVRGRRVPAEVAKPPFLLPKYYRKPQ
ncbi:putative mitochondrial aminomethyltransferase, mitochondrial precursor [Leptomonas pyrrhocoris]|uniref:Aminomethyltransferase n=1 Tax=Leptomonas pyrrhocoris TaxID=157538 RepID=A0A0M9G3C6_LEPPY|nr:putative mitochondrial aminomethyltransferase, mitochondrial precursor [Leptomonas pyrrhocoris]KPA81397.1 putative mitochondrial aminomethyltransferase, mitochondrial precursor [Leptomonas pyrrhocoris]|eukprot:XP_015659836.1 putative mitochondrial aminomethyltransferase, mitochondrial precursor [Leptomonas pyrrhocoris]